MDFADRTDGKGKYFFFVTLYAVHQMGKGLMKIPSYLTGFSLILLSILLVACAGRQPVAQAPPAHQEATGLVLSIEAMTHELLSSLEDADPFSGDLADGLVVATFVESNKLTRTSSFGRYLSEQLMNEFQRHAYKVIEIRKSEAIHIQERRGEFGLARQENTVPSEIAVGAMLSGTYMIGQDDILVTARIIDNRSATLLASSTVIFPKNMLTTLMLSDTASARLHTPKALYLKEMDL